MSMVVEVGGGGGEVNGLFRRATSQRESLETLMPRAKAPVQIRIDTGPWTSKGKSAKEAIGWAWSK
jgi:hypothetical protein